MGAIGAAELDLAATQIGGSAPLLTGTRLADFAVMPMSGKSVVGGIPRAGAGGPGLNDGIAVVFGGGVTAESGSAR